METCDFQAPAHAAETPQPIKMKFCTIDYVGKLRDVPKTVVIGCLAMNNL
jgi:hypothetical protein